MLHNVINCHHVSVALAIVIGVALQEYNILPRGISGTTQCDNKCLKIEYFNLYTIFTTLIMLQSGAK